MGYFDSLGRVVEGLQKVGNKISSLSGKVGEINPSRQLKLIKKAQGSTDLETLNRQLRDFSQLRISDIDKTTKEGAKLAEKIRDIRKIRSAASKAELEFMQAHPELGTLLKSGSREFSSAEAKAGIEAARMQAFKDAGFGLSRGERFMNGLRGLGEGSLNAGKKAGKWSRKHPFKAGALGLLAVPTAGLLYAYNNGTGWTNTVMDLIGNNTRKKDGTPIITVNRDFDDMSSNAQEFLQDAIDKKQVPGKWSTPEEREIYFKEHPNDTIRTGWIGRLTKELKEKGITESDYKKYYGIDYGSLSDMPGATGFGINIVRTQDGLGRLDPITAGLYETQQSMGSFPLAYVKDGVLTDGESWDFKKADKTKKYSGGLTSRLRTFAGRHGTNETDTVPPIVTSNMKIPYKKRNKK